MEAQQKTSVGMDEEALKKQLKGMLYQIELASEAMNAEAIKSYKLLEVDEKTDMVRYLETLVNNPLGVLAKRKDSLDGQGVDILDTIVKIWFNELKDKAQTVFRTDTCKQDLHYCIVLKEDNSENRMEFLNILDWIANGELGERFYLNFRFVSKESATQIPRRETIIGA